MKTIVCIGAGNVGRSWAMVFARAGLQVRLYDQDMTALHERVLPLIAASLADQQAAGLLDDAAVAAARIVACDTLEAAIDGADYVQESVSERLELKQQVFRAIDAGTRPDCILASSTSAIPGSEFMHELRYPGRALIVHPVNPPHLIPLVELCATEATDPDVVDEVNKLMASLGQVPIVLTREIRGFILNRLQFALVGELMHLVAEGYCSPEDADKAVRHGLAMRWAFLGPTEVAHLNATEGFLGFVDGLGDMMKSLAREARVDYAWTRADAEAIHAATAKAMPVGRIADFQRWRDRRIMALRAHLSEMETSEPRPPGSSE
jgi:L-gulonate 3-dehydrogenase